MADKVPVKGGYDGSSLTGLAEFVSGDTLGIAHGGTGLATIGSNQLVTGNGTSAVTSESNLTFDGTILKATGDLCATVKVVAPALCIGSEYVLPTSDGSAGQLICTDGSGALAFADAASSGHTIAEDGSALASRTCLNFVGAAVTAADNSGTNATDVTVCATNALLKVREADGTQCCITLTSAAIGDCLQGDTSPTLGGNLDVNGKSIVSASNGNIPITPNGSGIVIIDGICHPTADGSAGQVMCTNGSNALVFATASAGVTLAGSTDNTVATVTGSNALCGEGNLIFDGTRLGVNNTSPSTVDGNTDVIVVGDGNANADVIMYGPTDGNGVLGWTDTANTTNQGYLQYLHASDAMLFGTAATEQMRIDSSGNVGIGTSTPEGTLNVFTASAGSVTPDTDADDLVIENSGDVGIQLISPDANYSRIWFNHPSGGSAQIRYSNSTQSMHFKAGSNEPLNIDSSGRIGIGTATMAQKLDIYTADAGLPVMTMCNTSGCGRGLGVFAGCGCSNQYLMRVSSNHGNSVLLFTGDGNLGIGTTAPISGNGIPSLDIYKSDGTCRVTLTPCMLQFCNTCQNVDGGILGGIGFGGRDSGGTGNTYACIYGCIADATHSIEKGNLRLGVFCCHSAGVPLTLSWNCATVTCLYAASCICAQTCIGAATKNFEIEHPLASNESPNKYNQRRLIHSTLEGPEYGVYYRGTGQLSNGAAQIDLPEYFEALADKESATIQFTPVFGLSHLTIKSNDDCAVIYNNKFCVCTDDSGNQNQCFHWFVQGRRIDKHVLCTIAQGDRPGAYDDGRLCVERWRYREELVDNLSNEGLESMTCAELDDFINFNNTWDSEDPVFVSDYESVSKANKIIMIGNALDSVLAPVSETD